MKEENRLDKIFKENLSDHEIKPSESVWDRIEGELPQQKKRGGGLYVMRAATVALLIGLSTWFTFDPSQPDSTLGNPTNIGTQIQKEKEKNKEKEKGTKEKSGKDKTSEKKENPKKETIPILRPRVKSNSKLLVSADPVPVVAEEELEDELLMDQVALRVDEELKPEPLRVKVRYRPDMAIGAFYEEEEQTTAEAEENPELKERVVAYASDQFNNLISGKPLELPKTEKKPRLEVNLGKWFNN